MCKLNIELHFNWKDKQRLLGGVVLYYFPHLVNFTLFTHEDIQEIDSEIVFTYFFKEQITCVWLASVIVIIDLIIFKRRKTVEAFKKMPSKMSE